MKKNYILALLLGTIFLTGCQDTLTDSSTGYLYLSDVTVQIEDKELLPTRGLMEDLSLTLELWQGETLQKTLTEEDLQNKLKISTGAYTLKAYSSNYLTYGDWTNDDKGEPVYYTEVPFVIEADKTNVVKVELGMITFGVRLELPEGFSDYFPQHAFTATVGNRTVALDQCETAYFPYTEDALIEYTLEATNTDGEEMSAKKSYSAGLKPNTLYIVTYDFGTKSVVSLSTL